MAIIPIQTEYDGYRFRSRLEARWAVFFNTAGIPYRYESEGYDVEGTWYLPDFWLPDQGCWVEIKPTSPNNEELKRMQRLTEGTGHRGYIIGGNIPYPYPTKGWIVGYTWDPAGNFVAIQTGAWVQCPVCLKIDIAEGLDQPPGLEKGSCSCVFELQSTLFRLARGTDYCSDSEYGDPEDNSRFLDAENRFEDAQERVLNLRAFTNLSKTQRLRDAYYAARQARFEFRDPYFQPLSEEEKLLCIQAEWNRILKDLETRGTHGHQDAMVAARLYGWLNVIRLSGHTLELAISPKELPAGSTAIDANGKEMSAAMYFGQVAEQHNFSKPLLASVQKCCGIQISRVSVSPLPQH